MQTLSHNNALAERHLLLIEDNDDDVEILSQHLDLLKKEGMSFERSDCLAHGIRRLDKGGIGIILLDLTLPDSTGIATVKRIHEAAPSIPLIILTGTDDNDMAMQALRYGAQDYLIKGLIDMPSLCRSISYAVLRHEAVAATEKLAAIVETSEDAIVGQTLEGTITSWNRGAEQIYGYSQDEAMGKSLAMLIPATATDEFSQILETLKRGAAIHTRETVRVTKCGQEIDVSITISPIKQLDGNVTGSASIARDITQRKRAESDLRDMEQRLSLALKAGDVGVWDLNLVNNTVWRSLRHDEIFGHHSSEWSFDTFLTYVLPEDRSYAERGFKLALETGHFNMECRVVRADKLLRWIDVRGETSTDANGLAVRLMGTITDITDRKKQEEQTRLVIVMEEREDFMATLTHDMKNPLIGANRLLELLVSAKLGVLTEEQVNLLRCLMESNLGVLSLLRNLIDVYKWEKDVNMLLLTDVDLISQVHESVKQLMPVAKVRGININFELPERMSTVKADFVGVQRILMNLLDNAMKFTPKGGTITVRLFPTQNHAVIEVEDNGPGIKLRRSIAYLSDSRRER